MIVGVVGDQAACPIGAGALLAAEADILVRTEERPTKMSLSDWAIPLDCAP